ncbi:hypothetical protein [Pseudopedobacter beijingensis]|uniref:Glycosyl transferase n=1 Tax=Pseudopedobacter beijingensis TaxID=1207056 RepID=A0ABW4I980_9SPHI
MMMKASYDLPKIPSFSNGLPVYFLTGKKFIYQTLFCAYSLVKHSKEIFQFILVDDGSFDDKDIVHLQIKMPHAKLVLKEEIAQNLQKILPVKKFPFLHHKRKVYPHIKKLTDIHTLQDNPYKIVLDSDMLFWKEPEEIIEWLKKPNNSIYMLDCEESYGYSRELMFQLCGHQVPELMNVGAIGFSSKIINWEILEKWGSTLEQKEGTSYYLEQALTAMLIAGQHSEILNKKDYIVNPSPEQIKNTEGILHHYVDLSKEGYFKTAWKKIH